MNNKKTLFTNNKKILFTIIGVICIVLGILCIFFDELPVFLCGVGLVLYGIVQFFHWRERKKVGAAGFWAFLGMALALAVGVIILIESRPGSFALRFLLIMLSIWLIAEGGLEILGAIMYRKAMTSADLGVQAPGSAASMVLGSIMVIVGILGLVFPLFAEVAVLILIVAELILSGVRMIWLARTAGDLEESDE